MKLGIMGGTFDPIHLAHLVIAQVVLEELGLDKVLFIPAARPPHKERPRVTAEDRLKMTRLAVAGHDKFECSDIELRREGPSFTVMTLDQLREQFGPSAEFFLIVGADSLVEMDTWREPERIARMARLVVVPRPGFTLSAADLSRYGEVIRVEMPEIGLASAWIRKELRRGRDLRYVIPEPARRYIIDRELYRD